MLFRCGATWHRSSTSSLALSSNEHFVCIPNPLDERNILVLYASSYFWRNSSSLDDSLANERDLESEMDNGSSREFDVVVELENAHQSPVSCLCLSPHGVRPLLLSASSDGVYVWRLWTYLSSKHAVLLSGEKECILPCCLISDCGIVHRIRFDEMSGLAVVCLDDLAMIVSVEDEIALGQLQGHSGRVLDADIAPLGNRLIIFTCSDDRTFKLWDWTSRSVLFESSILCAASLTSISFDVNSSRLVVGSSDGNIRIFSCSPDDGYCSETGIVDLSLFLSRKSHSLFHPREEEQGIVSDSSASFSIISSQPQQHESSSDGLEITNPVEKFDFSKFAEPILLARFACANYLGSLEEISSLVQSSILIISSSYLFVIHARSLEIQSYHGLKEWDHSSDRYISSEMISASFWIDPFTGLGRVSYLSGVSGSINLAEFIIVHRETESCGLASEDCAYSSSLEAFRGVETESDAHRIEMVSSNPLPAHLLSSWIPRSKDSKPSTRSSNSVVQNKPVTFHSKVRSSGYSRAPEAAAYLSSSSKRAAARGAARGTRSKKMVLSCGEDSPYPIESNPPIEPQDQHNLLLETDPVHNGPISSVCFSSDASRLITSSADQTVRFLRLPVSKHRGDGSSCVGHNGPVTFCSVSSRSPFFVLSSSEDRTCRLWDPSRKSDPLLIIDSSSTNLSSSSSSSSSEHSSSTSSPASTSVSVKSSRIPSNSKLSLGPVVRHRYASSSTSCNPVNDQSVQLHNSTFNLPVLFARFYYQDKFICASSGKSLFLYKYYIDDDPKDDIKRLQNNNKYKSVLHSNLPSQSITSLSCANMFSSSNVFLST